MQPLIFFLRDVSAFRRGRCCLFFLSLLFPGNIIDYFSLLCYIHTRKQDKEEYVMKKLFLLLVIFSLTNFPVFTTGNKISVKTMPPVVIKTIPQAGDTSVDPALKEIRVTFSKEMMTNNQWSWVKISDETFPEITGDTHYLKDKKTCVLPVKLEPGKTYVIRLNWGKFNYFKDENGNSAIPYQLVFETKR